MTRLSFAESLNELIERYPNEAIALVLQEKLEELAECHCGKDGHALNSINCPVHGYEIKMKMARDLANWEI